MNSLSRLPLLANLWCLGLALLGCSEGTVPPAEPDGTCTRHSDCPESVPSFCDTQPLDRGAWRCLPLCSADADCSPLACRNGQCVEPPSAEAVAYCRVTPDFILGRPGLRVSFAVEMQDAAGKPVVPAQGIVWTAATGAVTGGGTGTSAVFTLAVPGAAGAAVEARMGATSCRAQVIVLSAHVPPGQVRAVVTNELTGRPLPGAVVAVSDAQGNISSSSETDALGVAWVPATGVVNLTVFHQAYNYLTLTNYDTQQGTRDVALPLRANPIELHGGARGTFTGLPAPASQDLLLGLAGMSLPALGLDVDNRQLSGPSNSETLTFFGKQYEVELPSNSYLSLSSTVFKAEYTTPGVAGVCDERLMEASEAEQAIGARTCGTRTSFALAGEVPLSELSLREFESKESFAQVLMQNPAVLRRFGSSVVRDVQFQLKPFKWAHNEYSEYRNTAHYAEVKHSFQQLPLAFQFAVELPMPPRHFGLLLDRISIIGAVNTPGQGFTGLGLGFARLQDDLRSPRLARVYMAPAHHGLEGNPYRLIVIANDQASFSQYVKGGAASLLLVPLTSLLTEPLTGSPVTISRNFLPIPGGARFNFNLVPDGQLQGRQFRFITALELDDATMLRVLFTSRENSNWVVLVDARHATTGFRLPVPPSGFSDRTLLGDEQTERSTLTVQMISVRTASGEPLSPQALAEQEEASLARLSDFVLALSQFNYDKPGLSWVAPTKEKMSIVHAATVTVALRDFRISSAPENDGHVMLSFEGGTGCAGNNLRATVNTDQPQGEVDFKLPEDCRGTAVRMTATLVDARGAPLSPPVSTSRLIDII